MRHGAAGRPCRPRATRRRSPARGAPSRGASRSPWRASSTGRRPSPSPSTRPPMVSRPAGRSSGSTSAGLVRSVRSRAASCRSRWRCRPAGRISSSSGAVSNADLTGSIQRRIVRCRLDWLTDSALCCWPPDGSSPAPPPGLLAQNTVNLQGRVTGAGGAPLAAAQITVANRETGQQRGAVTSPQGTYTIVGLPPGAYHVSLRLLGYGSQERDIELLVGQHATLDFQLQQAAVAVQGVEVVHQREPSFEVQRNDVSALVVTNEILNLPLNSRNTMNLAAIVPGIKTFAPTAGRSLPSSGSLPDLRFWNFYLDGAEWKSFFNGNLVGIPQTGSPLPQEAMREFRVHLNPYDAQYTRGASFVISAVTQRGTNEVHGSVFGYGQSNALKALDLSQREKRTANPAAFAIPDYSRGQLGFNLRGPIRRDRLFFAVSYEGQSTNDGFNVVPLRPSYRPDIWDAYSGTFKAPTQNHTGVVRLTAPLGGAHTLDAVWAGRYYNSETNFGDQIAHNAGIKAKYWIHSVQLRHTYTPSSGFVNEASLNVLSWSHHESPLVPGVTLVYPDRKSVV